MNKFLKNLVMVFLIAIALVPSISFAQNLPPLPPPSTSLPNPPPVVSGIPTRTTNPVPKEKGILPDCVYDKEGEWSRTPDCHFKDLIEFVNIALDFIIKLAVVIAPISFAWAGFLILTSGGDPGKLKQGKEILVKVGIGFAIILAAYLVISFIMNTFVLDGTFIQLLERK